MARNDVNHVAHILGLPIPRTALVGRERELGAVHSILAETDTRLLTLTGVGGCGKTRLAFRLATDVAPDYPERIWAVELASVADPELISIVVAGTLGLQGRGARSSTAALKARLGERPAFLVLDNCEHLIDACGEFVDALLDACPGLRVLATSREPLHVAGERQYRVPPLDIPGPDALGAFDVIAASPAVQLFVTRARAVEPAFELNPDTAPTVARICDRVEGIPLAVELAAARVRVLGVGQILARLDDSFRLLTTGSRVAPTRHQTLQAALDWSQALLTETEQAVFCRLAVFAGDFRLEAVDVLCVGTGAHPEVPPDRILDVLSALIDKSLVMTENDDHAAWYRLLEPVRQYALGQLAARGEVEEARARHAEYYLELAECAADGVRGPEQEIWLGRLEREQGNLRATLDWARQREQTAIELRVGAALVPFWGSHGHQTEGLQRLSGMLARDVTTQDPALRARALSGAARLSIFVADSVTSRFSEAEEFAGESLRLARELGDELAIATAFIDLGLVYQRQGEFAHSIACLEEAVARFRELNDEHGTALALVHLGVSVKSEGDVAEGSRLLVESGDRFRALGDLRWATIVQVFLGRMAYQRGDSEQAIELIVEGMTTHQRLGDRWFVAFELTALGGLLIAAGQARQGVRLVGAARALADRLGSPGLGLADVTARVDTLRQEEWFDDVWDAGYELDRGTAVLEARALLDERRTRDLLAPPEEPDFAPLTPRELEVSRLLAEGHTDREIADSLFIALRTVGTHVHNILHKLELQSRVQVAGWLASREPSDSGGN